MVRLVWLRQQVKVGGKAKGKAKVKVKVEE
jgi:hypothetical protein